MKQKNKTFTIDEHAAAADDDDIQYQYSVHNSLLTRLSPGFLRIGRPYLFEETLAKDGPYLFEEILAKDGPYLFEETLAKDE
ncbi:hypothetical protein DPMN_004298 [Dreissena polymorpha]|uniref:Uncharacterized protein n=1 Tax=Dreissena polymorpha TaxID=45954 RepID=A0A9D4MR16_DREPO|nr:hypothetical protein DPMN_004298 [Dreissena polymorpha]